VIDFNQRGYVRKDTCITCLTGKRRGIKGRVIDATPKRKKPLQSSGFFLFGVP